MADDEGMERKPYSSDLTDAQWLGFRLVRPLKTPSVKEMYQYWNNGVQKE